MQCPQRPKQRIPKRQNRVRSYLRQSKIIPGILLTRSFNQVDQIPLAVPAVIAEPVESCCQKKKTSPIVSDSQSNKAKVSQLSVVPETRSLQEETTATKSHTFPLLSKQRNEKKKTVADKDTSQAAKKEIKDKLHPVETVETCAR